MFINIGGIEMGRNPKPASQITANHLSKTEKSVWENWKMKLLGRLTD